MYLKLRNKYKTFINTHLIFTKSCISILLLNNKNVFLPLFCLLSMKIEAFKHIWGNTARFLCFFQKRLFFAFEKLFVSMTWNFGNKFGQLNKWYRPYRLYWISWKLHFYFVKKNPCLKSSLFWSGYLNILISYSKSHCKFQIL